MSPEAEATRDYIDGLGQEANPYQRGTNDWWNYALKMCEHQTRELKDLRNQVEGA